MPLPQTFTRPSLTFPITQKGQVTLPAEVRRRLGVGPKDRIEYVIDDDGTVRVQAARSRIDQLGDSIKAVPGREERDYEEVRHLMLEDLADKIVRDMGGR